MADVGRRKVGVVLSPIATLTLATHVLLGAAVLVLPAAGADERPRKSEVDTLNELILNGDLMAARKLISTGIDLSAPDRFGMTPLSAAIYVGQSKFAVELIERGVNVNPTPAYPSAPLLDAAVACDQDTLASLLQHGAKVNYSNEEGDTALLEASGNCPDGSIVRILLAAGADANGSAGGLTPLMAAAWIGNERAIEALLAAGADPDAVDDYGDTALSIAETHPMRTDVRARICAALEKARRR
jgi:uncharacterized protein